MSDLFLPHVCILSVRGLMNNWISIFAHINRQRPIEVTISGKKATLVLFWLSVYTRTRSHVETCSTVARSSCCRAATFLVLLFKFACGSNSTLSLVCHWTSFELLAPLLQRIGGLYHGRDFQYVVVFHYKYRKGHVNQNDTCLIPFYLE